MLCLTLHLHSIDGSHAGSKKIRWDFVLYLLVSGSILANPHWNSGVDFKSMLLPWFIFFPFGPLALLFGAASTLALIPICSPCSYKDRKTCYYVCENDRMYRHSLLIRISLLPLKIWVETGWKKIFPWGAWFRNTLLTNVRTFNLSLSFLQLGMQCLLSLGCCED